MESRQYAVVMLRMQVGHSVYMQKCHSCGPISAQDINALRHFVTRNSVICSQAIEIQAFSLPRQGCVLCGTFKATNER